MKARLAVALLGVVGVAHAQPKSFQIDQNALVLPAPVPFETGAATLASGADVPLGHVKAYLSEKSYVSLLRIEAHTDGSGDAAANQKLSEQRALAVARWLVAQGVDCKRVLPVGFGGTKPVAANDTPEGRDQNRRVTVVNAALAGRAIGGLPVDGGGRVAGDPCAP